MQDRSALNFSSLPLLLALCAAGSNAAARQDCSVTTVPLPRELHQPDGSPIELFFRGTGFNHWYEDAQGFAVTRTEIGFVYAQKDAGGKLAPLHGAPLVGKVDPATLGLTPHVAPKSTHSHGGPHSHPRQEREPSPQPIAAGTGTLRNLVLMLRFSDHGPSGQDRTLPDQSGFDRIMNATGGDPVLAPTGSVRDHFLEGSYGQSTVDSTVHGWIDVPETEAYYAAGSSGLTPQTWELIIDGLNAADPFIDFSQFDVDGDGWIDGFTLLHSGYGAEWGGSDQYGTDFTDRMWSHKWTIPTWTSAEGIKVADYNISPGLWSTGGDAPGRIGVICHEIGHFFGLPDLYDINGNGQGMGNWGLMGSGSWGFAGDQLHPSHMSAWSKLKLGWTEAQRILPGDYSLQPIETTQSLFMIDSGYPTGEYLLIENRQQSGFDQNLPQEGLLSWHIDEEKGSLTFNDVNADEGHPNQGSWPENGSHYRVALLAPDGDFDLERNFNRGDSGDIWRAPFYTSIDGTTTPGTDAYRGGDTYANENRIENIQSSGDSMTFTYVNTAAPTVAPDAFPSPIVGVPFTASLNQIGGDAPFVWSEQLNDATYQINDLGLQSFTSGGTALTLFDDDGVAAIDLPFQFPFFEENVSQVFVTPNGHMSLSGWDFEWANDSKRFAILTSIAPLWDNLTTAPAGTGIYVDSNPNSVRILWEAETLASATPVNFSVTLDPRGTIRFDYGAGNDQLSPTVGLSKGEGSEVLLVPTHDGEVLLEDASSIEFMLQGSGLPPGLNLAQDGTLSGTPTQGGTFTFDVRVRDNLERYDIRRFNMFVRHSAPAGDKARASSPRTPAQTVEVD